MMAHFKTVTQRVFEECCVECRMMLFEELGTLDILTAISPHDVCDFVNKGDTWSSECNTRGGRTRVGILKDVEEIGSYAAIPAGVSVTHNPRRRRFRSKEHHQ